MLRAIFAALSFLPAALPASAQVTPPPAPLAPVAATADEGSPALRLGFVPADVPATVRDVAGLRAFVESLRTRIAARIDAARRERDSRLVSFWVTEIERLAALWAATLERIDPAAAGALRKTSAAPAAPGRGEPPQAPAPAGQPPALPPFLSPTPR